MSSSNLSPRPTSAVTTPPRRQLPRGERSLGVTSESSPVGPPEVPSVFWPSWLPGPCRSLRKHGFGYRSHSALGMPSPDVFPRGLVLDALAAAWTQHIPQVRAVCTGLPRGLCSGSRSSHPSAVSRASWAVFADGGMRCHLGPVCGPSLLPSCRHRAGNDKCFRPDGAASCLPIIEPLPVKSETSPPGAAQHVPSDLLRRLSSAGPSPE